MAEWTTKDVRALIAERLPPTWCGTSAERMAEIVMPILTEVRAKALEDAASEIGDECASSDYMGDHISDDGIEWWASMLRARARAEREAGGEQRG